MTNININLTTFRLLELSRQIPFLNFASHGLSSSKIELFINAMAVCQPMDAKVAASGKGCET